MKRISSIGVALLWFGASLLYTLPAVADAPQTIDVYAPFGCTVGVDCDVVGASQLVRSKSSVTMNIWTTGLDAGAAYTVWWVIFNDPAFCDGRCDGTDLGNPDVQGAVIGATGHVVGSTGTASFSASLREGDTRGDQPFGLPGDPGGLVDAMNAEIHLVVRTHGPVIPRRVYEQISTFAGGCDVNVCEDQQFAIHE